MSSENVQRIIVDLDVGTDDAFALLTLLFAEKIGKIKVEAIVCTMGNSYLHHVCKNVIKILEILERTDIPVYKGLSEPITPLPESLPHNFFFHGKDGFGDLLYQTDPDISIIKSIPASVAMNKLIVNSPGEISLVCIGPLTNAAATIKNFEQFAPNLKHIYVFGGNHQGLGNITEAAEFNFYVDPEAADTVLNNITTPVTLVTWDTSLDTNIDLEWRFKILGISQSPFIQLLNKIESKLYKDQTLDQPWITPDVFLVISMLYPEAIEKKITGIARVETQFTPTRGKTFFTPSETGNVTVITKINADIVKEVLLKATKFSLNY